MDLQFDNYTSYLDASTPRTPSLRMSICSDDLHPPFRSNILSNFCNDPRSLDAICIASNYGESTLRATSSWSSRRSSVSSSTAVDVLDSSSQPSLRTPPDPPRSPPPMSGSAHREYSCEGIGTIVARTIYLRDACCSTIL